MKKFVKLQASGNDFILFEVPESFKVNSKTKTLVSGLCDRHFGIGADGVIFLWKKNKGVFWRFFNSDGSETKVCGNATRCVCRYLLSEKKAKTVEWDGLLGKFLGKKISQQLYSTSWTRLEFDQVNLGVPDDLMELLTGFNDHGLAGAYFVNVGVPHLVLLNHEVWNPEQRFSHNALLRSFPSLGVEGANVTWVSLKTKGCVTFERGVESETLACGSGALAAYYSVKEYRKSNNQMNADSDESFLFPGGLLTVEKDKNGSIWLKGQAMEVFRGVAQL